MNIHICWQLAWSYDYVSIVVCIRIQLSASLSPLLSLLFYPFITHHSLRSIASLGFMT